MLTFDQLHRFVFSEYGVRGEIVALNESYAQVLAAYDYPPFVQRLLGELMAATSLLTATLKFEGDIALQLQSQQGPVNYVVVNGTNIQQLRAVARWDESQPLPETLAEALPNGTLVITITPDEGERYQGIVALDKPTLAECIEQYFQQSEQLPSKVQLYTQQQENQHFAGGLLLQVLPTSSDNTNLTESGFEHLSALAATLTQEELFSLPAEQLLYRLFHQEAVELFPMQPVVFKCSCSKERSASALASIDKQELLNIIEEEGAVRLDCQYCHQQYSFDAIDVEAIHQGNYSSQPQALQ